jgi:membrane dipeptidase
MRIPILDGHNDSLRHLYPYTQQRVEDFFARHTRGHVDLPRARDGGLSGGFFAVFIPAEPSNPPSADAEIIITPTGYEAPLPSADAEIIITPTGYEVPLAAPLNPSYAQSAAIAMTAGVFRLETAAQGQLKVVCTSAELTRCLKDDVIAVILHFEGAEAIDPQLDALDVFYRAGLRSLGLVWSRPNIFGHGVPFRFPHTPDTGPGLTDAGRALVRACNHLGIMLDISHLNERGFWDLAALTTAPIVATHSAVHTICPVSRNLTDKQLDAIRESDGMVGVNFEVSALRSDGYDEPNTSLDVLVRHIDYLVERLGIDRVGFGSDFDGATMPQELGDVAGLPKLIARLQQHGYDEPALRKLAYENWLRVLKRTWRE